MGADINEIAVLCATNSDGIEVEQALHAQNIEVVTETTTKLINQKSIKALLEYLKYQYFGQDFYMYNFFAIIAQDVRPIKRVDFNKIEILDVVKEAVEEFKLFSADFNIIRFLNAIARYSDIEALLFEYERMDVSAAASELNGVRVLTVHKSKGLEYEHVIVMDRLKKVPSSRDAIIYEYDDITLKNIYLRIKGRDAVDSHYAKALLKEKALVREDSLNALYVAFTRARENLIIVLKAKDSMFDILDLAPKRYGKLTCKTNSNKISDKTDFHALEYKELYYGTQSDILAVEKEKEEDIKSINFGIAMHYMLEMLGEFTSVVPDAKEQHIKSAKDMMINKYGHALEDEEIEDIQNRVKMLLHNEEFIHLISGECYREKALRHKNNLKYIDLLIKGENQWIVIDYKSALSHSAEHLVQVNSYVNAIKEITGNEADGYICYLLKDSIKINKL